MQSKRALIVIGHGSRRGAANDEFEGYVAKLSSADQSRGLPLYDYVGTAFLEFASPTLMQVCDVVVTEGFFSIDIYPVFLTLGKHVGKDIPQQVGEVMEKHPEIEVRLLNYLGASSSLPKCLLEHISEQQSQPK